MIDVICTEEVRAAFTDGLVGRQSSLLMPPALKGLQLGLVMGDSAEVTGSETDRSPEISLL